MKRVIKYLIISPCILGTIEVGSNVSYSAEYFEEIIQGLNLVRIQTGKTNTGIAIFIDGKLIEEENSSGITLDETNRKLIIGNISEELRERGFELETEFDVEIDSIDGLKECRIIGRDVSVLNRLRTGIRAEIVCNNFRNFGEIFSDVISVIGYEEVQNNALLNGRIIRLDGGRVTTPEKSTLALGNPGILGTVESSIVAGEELFIKASWEYRLANCSIQSKEAIFLIEGTDYKCENLGCIIDSRIMVSGKIKIEGGLCKLKNSRFVIENSLESNNVMLCLDEFSKINCGEGIIFKNGRGIKNEGEITSEEFDIEIESERFQELYKDLEERYLNLTQDKQHKFLRIEIPRILRDFLEINGRERIILGNFINRGRIKTDGKLRVISGGMIINTGEIKSGRDIDMQTSILLENTGVILNEGDLECNVLDIILKSPFGIRNIGGTISSVGRMQIISNYAYLRNEIREDTKGVIRSISDLSIITGSDCENVGSEILSEEDVRIKSLAILNDGGYIRGKKARFLINTNESDEIIETEYISSVSHVYQNYFPEREDMEYEKEDEAEERKGNDADENEEDLDEKEDPREKGMESKGIYELAGTLQNKGKGIIESAERLEIRASGNLENIDSSRITIQEEGGEEDIEAYGRLINDYRSQISGEKVSLGIRDGYIWNAHGSEILGGRNKEGGLVIRGKNLRNLSMEGVLGGLIEMDVTEDIVNLGKMYGVNKWDIRARRLYNHGLMLSQDKITLALDADFGNKGEIRADEVMDISLKEIGIILLKKEGTAGAIELDDLLNSISDQVTAKELYIHLGDVKIVNKKGVMGIGTPICIEAGEFINKAELISDVSMKFRLLRGFWNGDLRTLFKYKEIQLAGGQFYIKRREHGRAGKKRNDKGRGFSNVKIRTL